LVIGNQADPITPFASAKVVADLLGDSAIIIEQDDYGHSSLAERSNCTIAAITEYFSHGSLPIEGTMCGTNQILFPGSPITKSSLAVSSSSTPISSDTDELDRLRSTNRALIIADIALCVIVLVLLVSLVFSFIRSRKARAGGSSARYDLPPTAMLRKDDFEDSSYMTPYDAPPTRK